MELQSRLRSRTTASDELVVIHSQAGQNVRMEERMNTIISKKNTEWSWFHPSVLLFKNPERAVARWLGGD